MTEKTVMCRWKPAAVLRVDGEDASNFLQGQFTNDLRELERKCAVYGLWLNHKGRVIADSFVVRKRPDEFLIVSYFCPANGLRERLEAFIIADDVRIEDHTAQWLGNTLIGGSFSDHLAGAENDVVIFEGRRTNGPHAELIYPVTSAGGVEARLQGISEVDATALECLRISEGIPAVPMDIGPGELPNEGGLEAATISYVKGCYLGQEVMARLKSMGQVRRRLFRVRGTGTDIPSPPDVYQGDRRIGELRTRTMTGDGFEALALLSLLNLKPNLPLGFSPSGQPTMHVVESP